jgi:RNA polymerase sigma factor (sigma-70 family)
MPDDIPFRDLIGRVRAGDAGAAEELVRRYEPTIRVVVRRRLTDPEMRRLLDTVDVCQSVLANLFIGTAAGQFELNEPEQLLKLLATMVRNKLASHARKQKAARRNRQRVTREEDPADPNPTPSQVVALQELWQQNRQRLSPEERRLVELRTAGHSWAEIAGQVGGTPDGLRMQHGRAIERLKQELGLED